MIKRKDFEVYNQKHQMYAEGDQHPQPTEPDIMFALKLEGYAASEIDMWFDHLQGFWRWTCKIAKD